MLRDVVWAIGLRHAVIRVVRVVDEPNPVAMCGRLPHVKRNKRNAVLRAEPLTRRRRDGRTLSPRRFACRKKDRENQQRAHSSNEKELSYRWRSRALLTATMFS